MSKVQSTNTWLPNPNQVADWKREDAIEVFLRESFHGEFAKFIPNMRGATKRSLKSLSRPELSGLFGNSKQLTKTFYLAVYKNKYQMHMLYPRHFSERPDSGRDGDAKDEEKTEYVSNTRDMSRRSQRRLARPPQQSQRKRSPAQSPSPKPPKSVREPPAVKLSSDPLFETLLLIKNLKSYLDEDSLRWLFEEKGFTPTSVTIESSGGVRNATLRFDSVEAARKSFEACYGMKDIHLEIKQIALDVHPVQVSTKDNPSSALVQTVLDHLDIYTSHVYCSGDSCLILYPTEAGAIRCVETLDGFEGWTATRMIREGSPLPEEKRAQHQELQRRQRVKEERRLRRQRDREDRHRQQERKRQDRIREQRRRQRELEDTRARQAEMAQRSRLIRQHECEPVRAWTDLPQGTCGILISNSRTLTPFQIEDILTLPAPNGSDVFLSPDAFQEKVHSILVDNVHHEDVAVINCFGYVTRDKIASLLLHSDSTEVQDWRPRRIGYEVVFEIKRLTKETNKEQIILGHLNRFGPIIGYEHSEAHREIRILYEHYHSCRVLSNRQRIGGSVMLEMLRIKSVPDFDQKLDLKEPKESVVGQSIVRFELPKMSENEKKEEEMTHRIMLEGGYTRADARFIGKKTRFASLEQALEYGRRSNIPTRQMRHDEENPDPVIEEMKRRHEEELARSRREAEEKSAALHEQLISTTQDLTEKFHFQLFLQQLEQKYQQQLVQWDREKKRILVMNASRTRNGMETLPPPPEPVKPDTERFKLQPPACINLTGDSLLSADQVRAQILSVTSVRDESILHIHETGDAWIVLIAEREVADAVVGGINGNEEFSNVIEAHKGLPARAGAIAPNLPPPPVSRPDQEEEKVREPRRIGRQRREKLDPKEKARRERIQLLRKKNSRLKRDWVDVPNVERSELFSLLTENEKIQYMQKSQQRIQSGRERSEKALQAFKNAQECDLCFCLDITGSMGQYMLECKSKIQNVLADVRAKWSHLKVRVAFVGYRDHGDEPHNGGTRFVVLDFSEDIPDFERKLDGVVCRGGVDWCEDVIGGLDQCLRLSWASAVRLLYHVCDAPPHGSIFYDYDAARRADRFPNAHEDLRLQPDYCDVLEQMRSEDIWYVVAKCRDDIDVMLKLFRRKADEMNDDDEYGDKWHIQGTDLSDASNLAKQLGKTINATIVTKSQAMMNAEMAQKTDWQNRSGRLTKYQANLSDVRYDEVNSAVWMCMDVEDIEQLTDDLRDVYMQVIPKEEMIRVSDLEKPFAKGAVRYCYFGRIAIAASEHDKAGFYAGYFHFLTRDNPEWKNEQRGRVTEQVVLKRPMSLDPKLNTVEAMQDEMIGQKTADYLAIQFNRILNLPPEKHLRFVPLKLVRIKDRNMEFHNFTAEPYLKGQFVKFSGNLSESIEELDENEQFENWEEIQMLALSYAHFTYEYTNKFMMVVDIQGFATNGWFVLTDPALHSASLKYPPTDMGVTGMTEYLHSHQRKGCNKYCRQWKNAVAREVAARGGGDA